MVTPAIRAAAYGGALAALLVGGCAKEITTPASPAPTPLATPAAATS